MPNCEVNFPFPGAAYALNSSPHHIYNIVLPCAHLLVVIPRLGRLICFARSSVLFCGLLQRLVVRLAFLRVELLLEIAGGGFVVAGLGVVSVCIRSDCNATSSSEVVAL
jgi:uncharacterized membrane protein YedE/YeeE